MTYSIRITRASGEQEVHFLTAAQTTIGSDAGSDICLRGEEKILPKHVLIAPQEEQCWISTTSGAPLWDQDGTPIEGAFVSWGARLTLGRCVFELEDKKTSKKNRKGGNRGAAAPDKGDESCESQDESQNRGIHPLVLMLLVASVAYMAWQALEPSTSSAVGGLPEAPLLFADKGRACQSQNPAHRAPIAEEQAQAKSERSVFDLQDGVAAVQLYAEASDCYAKAGKQRESEEVSRIGAAARESLQEEYALLRLRLGRELESGDFRQAAAQVRRLSQLLRHQSGGRYALALRRLSSRLSKKKARTP